MKPPRFDYAAPTSLSTALGILAGHEDVKILAGGQSLVPLLNMRLAGPELLLDINRLEATRGLELNDRLTIGPLVRQSEVERNPRVATSVPLLSEAIGWVGHPQIRNRGTVLGSVAHADPAAELPVAFLALDAEMTIASVAGSRAVPAEDFFVHIMETAIQPDEMLVEVSLPLAEPGSGWSFIEVARRHGDFAIASVAAGIEMDGETVRSVRIAMGGIAPVPKRARVAEEKLIGLVLNDTSAREAATVAMSDTEAISDVHGTAEYRRELVGALVERSLLTAADRARRRANA